MRSHLISPKLARRALLPMLALCFLPAAAFADSGVPGVGNFHQVNGQVYRGAQPTAEGFANLARLGVATIVDLREAGERSVAEQRIVKAAGMRYVSVPMKGLSAPAPQD